MPAAAHVPILEKLTAAELQPKRLPLSATLVDVFDAFRSDPDLWLLPVVDEDDRPVGAVLEREVRRLILDPEDHALLRDRSLSRGLAAHVQDTPTCEINDCVAEIIQHYHRHQGRQGMILTKDGRLFATLTNRRLLMLAAEQERLAAEERIARARRIEQASAELEANSASLSGRMIQLADAVQQLAEATADRAGTAGSRAAEVACAAGQTRDTLGELAACGGVLAQSFDEIERNVARNRSIAEGTASRIAEGADRARRLLEAAGSIDGVIEMISEIASTVNLLSLNASIEAARAGAAGAGFAVVAGEIRKLSDQTHDATGAITAQVESLRFGMEMVAADYADIETSIAKMAEGRSAIDRAVATEAEAARVIARNVADVGESSTAIEQSIASIAQSASSASDSARRLDGMASELRDGASALGGSVSTFLEVVRAA
jgi:methyl-accepting chemotaxis protein